MHMFTITRPIQSWLVFSLDHDEQLKYLYLDTDEKGIFVRAYGKVALESGILSKGEVLRAQAFLEVLTKLKKDLALEKKAPKFILLLPQEHFLQESLVIPDLNLKKKLSKQVQTFLEENKEAYSWLENHTYVPTYDLRTKKVYLEIVRADRYQSFAIIFQQAGFSPISIHGNLAAVASHLDEAERSVSIVVGEQTTRLVDFEYSHLLKEKRFEFSYQSLLKIIIKHLRLSSPERAQSILSEYGISRAHREESIYRELNRSLTPLSDVLRKRSTGQLSLSMLFLGTPLAGMIDTLEQQTRLPIVEIDPFIGKNSPFHQVLSLPAGERYEYIPLALAALATKK